MGGAFTMDVELGKIREFARATKSHNPDYLQAEQPVSPATFLMTSSFWSGGGGIPWEDVEGDLDLSRILHGGQEFVFYGEPPRAGTRLVGQSTIGATYSKQGRRGGTMRFVEVLEHFRTTDGRLVAEIKTTLITTSQPPAGSAAAGAAPTPDGATSA